MKSFALSGKGGPKVKTGIDVLEASDFALLKGKRVGIVTSPTGIDSKLRSTVDFLFEAPNVKLVALYGPEHGGRGDFSAGEHVDSYIDPFTKKSKKYFIN